MNPGFLLAVALITLALAATLIWALRGSIQHPRHKYSLKVLEEAPRHLSNLAQIRQAMDAADLKYASARGGTRLAATMRRAMRLNGKDCSHTRPGPRSVAKKRPSPPNKADLIFPTNSMS